VGQSASGYYGGGQESDSKGEFLHVVFLLSADLVRRPHANQKVPCDLPKFEDFRLSEQSSARVSCAMVCAGANELQIIGGD
jgi:hypothetical protein